MQEIARVIEDRGDTVLVRLERHSGCARCRHKCGLTVSHDISHVVMEVDNRLGARCGQKVKLEVADESGVLAALIVFLLPLICMLLGYFVGMWIATFFGVAFRETLGAITSVAFLMLWFVLVKLMDGFLVFSLRFQPQIVEVVDE